MELEQQGRVNGGTAEELEQRSRVNRGAAKQCVNSVVNFPAQRNVYDDRHKSTAIVPNVSSLSTRRIVSDQNDSGVFLNRHFRNNKAADEAKRLCKNIGIQRLIAKFQQSCSDSLWQPTLSQTLKQTQHLYKRFSALSTDVTSTR